MNARSQVVVIGGGLAGLSAGCYALASGFRVRVLEHNLDLGGVCTAWTRGDYTVDGCIQWLTGGPFERLYRELGILPRVSVIPLDRFATYRDLDAGTEIAVGRDLDAFAATLKRLSRGDAAEIDRLVQGAAAFASMQPPVDTPAELATLRDSLAALWNLRHQAAGLAHFRKTLGDWAGSLESEELRRFFLRLMPAEGPAVMLLFLLGYLKEGWLSRPVGGTARFRDALVESFRELGGQWQVNATVDEILVKDGRARGVRLADGTFVEGDFVLSTSSTPETVLRLLGGRYGAAELQEKVQRWKMFQPIVLASFGVGMPLAEVPRLLLADRLPPLEVGGVRNDQLSLRVCNDDPSFGPPGHAVVQAMLPTSYDWWATRGSRYQAEKDGVAEAALQQIDRVLPGVRQATRMTDVATPLTFWTMARSWRGAYEGWMPNRDSFFGSVKKTLPGLGGLYLAGQWVEPGGGVPTALMSGRQAVQLLCHDCDRPFRRPFPA